MTITKKQVIEYGKYSETRFIEDLIKELESAILRASENQKNNIIHPFHPLLESYIIELTNNEFEIEKYGLDKISISW